MSEAELDTEDVRLLFSDAYDGELSEDDQAAFDAALGADDALAEEYRDFVSVVDGTRSLHTGGGPPLDLLKSVQRKIRERSGGRYFRDRLEKKKQIGVAWLILILVAIVLVLAAAAYLGLTYFQAVEQDSLEGARLLLESAASR